MKLKQKISLVAIGFVSLSIPLGIGAVAYGARVRSNASEGTAVTTTEVPGDHVPNIKTTTFPSGQKNQPYSLIVVGSDPDENDTLKMSAFGLPDGFKLSNCQPFSTATEPNSFSCLVTGVPNKTGDYRVLVTIRDNHQASTQIRYLLTIK